MSVFPLERVLLTGTEQSIADASLSIDGYPSSNRATMRQRVNKLVGEQLLDDNETRLRVTLIVFLNCYSTFQDEGIISDNIGNNADTILSILKILWHTCCTNGRYFCTFVANFEHGNMSLMKVILDLASCDRGHKANHLSHEIQGISLHLLRQWIISGCISLNLLIKCANASIYAACDSDDVKVSAAAIGVLASLLNTVVLPKEKSTSSDYDDEDDSGSP